MSNASPTVFIVDPDPSVRATAEVIVRRAGWLVRSCVSVEEFLVQPPHAGPSCVLLAVEIDCINAMRWVEQLAQARREASIIVITRQGDVPCAVRIMRAGAGEVLMQPVEDETLLAAIGSGLSRSRSICQEEEHLLELQRRYDLLSGREREVMRGVVTGRLNKQVAGALGISEITVKVHRRHAMEKMGAGSLAQLVSMALQLFPELRSLAHGVRETGAPAPRATVAAERRDCAAPRTH